jgi:hypothetical protein
VGVGVGVECGGVGCMHVSGKRCSCAVYRGVRVQLVVVS